MLLAAAACAPAATHAPPSGPPAADPVGVAEELRRATVPLSPRRAVFGWELDEAGSRFSGRGVARFEAPERFRLDLFGPRGETYLSAALVGEEVRAPAALAERFKLPSPALLWGAVGAVVPPADARLLGASVENGRTVVRYTLGATDALEYVAEGGLLRSVRRLARGGTAESIDLEYSDGALRRARYRDWAAYRTLTLNLERFEDVPAFSEDTWTPPGTAR